MLYVAACCYFDYFYAYSLFYCEIGVPHHSTLNLFQRHLDHYSAFYQQHCCLTTVLAFTAFFDFANNRIFVFGSQSVNLLINYLLYQ